MDKRRISVNNLKIPKLSRQELLKWVNDTVEVPHKQIEELCSGVAYCQMLESMFPGMINMKKVKYQAKYEHEKWVNWKLLEAAFLRLDVESPIPIDRVLKGTFRDNLDFLRFFKMFYDAHGKSADAAAQMKIIDERPDLSVIKEAVKMMQLETKSYQQQIAEIKQFVGQLTIAKDKGHKGL